MKRKIALVLALALCFSGCGKKEEVKEKEEPEKVVEEAPKVADWDAVLDGTQTFAVSDEESLDINSLPDAEKYYFAFADVDGDDELELCVRTRTELYVINYKDEDYKVIYKGSIYEEPVDSDEKHGIYYYYNGAAPDHEYFKFIEIDDEGTVLSESFASRYDTNENNIYDEEDTYFLDEEQSSEVNEATWKSEANFLYHYVENYAPFRHPMKWLENNGVRDVTWNNSYGSGDDNYTDNTIITFKFDDGTEQEVDTGYKFGVQKLSLIDMDNDENGTDEFVIIGSITDLDYQTASFIYKLDNGKISQLDYKSSIEAIKDSSTFKSLYSSVYYYGNLYSALDVSLPANDSVFNDYDLYGSTIYYSDGGWQEFLGHYTPYITEYTCPDCGELMCKSYEEIFALNEGYSDYTAEINELIYDDLTVDGLAYIYNKYSAGCGEHSSEYTEYYSMIEDYSLVDSARYLRIDVAYLTELYSAPAPWTDTKSFYYDLQTGQRIKPEEINNI